MRMTAFPVLVFGLLVGAALSHEEEGIVRFSTREEGERAVISAENTHPAMPYSVEVDFPVRENLAPSHELPARFVIPPASGMDLLWLDRIDPTRATRLSVTYVYGKGDPNAVPDDDCVYLFPFAHGAKYLLSQGYLGNVTHQGTYALDFQLPEGDAVHAAREGIVVDVKQDSRIGGAGAEYLKQANHVNVLHADGTWACYSHLQTDGARVKVGEKVKQGQLIGLSGSTGQASGPHLHFAVCRATWGKRGGETIPTRFRSIRGQVVSPEEGRFYYSVHPDGAEFEPVLGELIRDEDLADYARPVPDTGRVSIRAEEIDGRVFIYCANGIRSSQEVTISFATLSNFDVSREVPYSRVVPSLREAFMLSLTRRFASGQSAWRGEYEIRYSWRSAR